MKWWANLCAALGQWRNGTKSPAKPEKRICARCNVQIKRNERWTRKEWDDGLPRHIVCPTAPEVAPTLETIFEPDDEIDDWRGTPLDEEETTC